MVLHSQDTFSKKMSKQFDTLRMPSVLIADSNQENVLALQKILAKEGYSIFNARSARQIFEIIGTKNIDIILLNSNLEDTSGYKICEQIHAKTRYASIPIVMVTSLASSGEKIKALKAGAQDFLVKPIDKIELQTRIRNLLQTKLLYDNLEKRNKYLEKQISERVEAQKQLNMSEARKTAIFNMSMVSNVLTNHEGNIIEFNAAAEALFGYTHKEIIGKPLAKLLVGGSLRRFGGARVEISAVRADDSIFPAEVAINPIYLEGHFPMFHACFHDLTKYKEAEEKIKQAHKREVQISAKIQQNLLLGKIPKIPYVQAAALTIPSQQVDGDFYDFFKYNEKCLDVMVVDVMGKGIAAAMLGAAFKSHILRAITYLSSHHGKIPEPKEIIRMVHSEMTKELIALDSFITLCYARFDLERKQMDLVNCGHPKAIYYQHSSNKCNVLSGSNMPLGFIEDEIYEQISIPISQGDLFFFYSDGITDVKNNEQECFGENRLMDFLEQSCHCEAQELIDKMKSKIISFTKDTCFCDDLTGMALKIGENKITKNLTIVGDLTQLDLVRSFIKAFCQDHISNVEKKDVYLVELAANEVITNVIQHALKEMPKQMIQIEATYYQEWLSILVWHKGEFFAPVNMPEPKFDGSQENGFGLFLMAKCMDKIEYIKENDKCGILLKKKV